MALFQSFAAGKSRDTALLRILLKKSVLAKNPIFSVALVRSWKN
jgi:hypothetical protein